MAAGSPSVRQIWLCGGARSGFPGRLSHSQGISILGVALSWARSSCRALYVAAGCGDAPSWARRRWRGEPDPRRLLHWQHRAPVASGVKYHQRHRSPSGPRPGSDRPHRSVAPGAAVQLGPGRERGPGSLPAGPMSHNGDAGLRKMAAEGRGCPRCPRARYCACALRAAVGRMRTPPRASSCLASREGPCGHHGGVRRRHQCPPATLLLSRRRRRPDRRFS